MLSIRTRDTRHVVLTDIDPMVMFCLRQVPSILANAESAGVRERLHPDAMPNDPARNAEWHRLMDSELRHLFEAACKTLERDLERFDAGREEIVFPADHLRAWMSAVNQARIVLSEQYQFDEEDMQRVEFAARRPRDAALVQVQLLGYVLQVMVEHALEGA